jgi:hypothetical protein
MTMTQSKPKLSEAARQGNPRAIGILINRRLASKQMTARVTAHERNLCILIEAELTPIPRPIMGYLRRLFSQLQAPIDTVKVYGRRRDHAHPGWSETLTLPLDDSWASKSTLILDASSNLRDDSEPADLLTLHDYPEASAIAELPDLPESADLSAELLTLTGPEFF